MVYKNNLNKLRKIQVLNDLCGYFGPLYCNFVSMRKQGTCCVAPKLRGVHFEGSIILQVHFKGSKTPWGKFAVYFFPAEFRSL